MDFRGKSKLVDEARAKAADIREYAEKPVLPQAIAFSVRKIMNEDAAVRRST